MSTKTIHFVYTVPFSPHILRRGLDKALRLAHVPPLHRLGWDPLIPWQRPIRAPHSISYHLLHALQGLSRVRFYSLYERGRITLGPDDIFIGQPVPQGGFSYEGRPETDDPHSVTSATLRHYQGSSHKKALIMPYANDETYISWTRTLSSLADRLILVGGDYWRKDTASIPLGDLTGRKVLGVNMCVAPEEYPFIKTSFNPPGQRKFLYVGHTGWYKNIAELERIAAAIPGFQGGHIGIGEIRGWKKISNFTRLTPDFMQSIAKEYDIFVNTSSADPQATTILEHMCFGFPIACTAESGYTYDSVTRLSTTDTSLNCAQLNRLQYEDEAVLKRASRENLEHVVQSHNWKNFTDAITSFIGI